MAATHDSHDERKPQPIASKYGISYLHLLDFYGFHVGKYTVIPVPPLDGFIGQHRYHATFPT